MSEASTQSNGIKLVEGNYNVWEISVMGKLLKAGAEDWIETAITPTPPVKNSDEDKMRRRACGIIIDSLDESQFPHIERKLKDPKGMWDALAKHHREQVASTRYFALNQLFKAQLNADETLPELATRIDSYVNNLNAMFPSGFTVPELMDELAIQASVNALPEEYSNLKTTVLASAAVTRSVVNTMFRNEHKLRSDSSGPSAAKASNKASTSTKGKSFQKGPQDVPVCSHCGKHRHTLDKCWALHPDLKPKRKQDAKRTEEAKDKPKVERGASTNASRTSHHPSKHSANSSWNADSGATSDMTPHKHWIRDYKRCNIDVRLADRTVVPAIGIGKVVFAPVIDGKPSELVEFTRVLHVPSLTNNLWSILHATDECNVEANIVKGQMRFTRGGRTLLQAEVRNKVGYLNGRTIPAEENVYAAAPAIKITNKLLHGRLGHIGEARLKQLVKNKWASGIETLETDEIGTCEHCIAGKQHRLPFQKGNHIRAKQPLELVHSDLHGPLPTRTLGGKRYWVTFIDDYSHFMYVYVLASKDETFDAFCSFKALAENQTGHKLKRFQDDKGGEFIGTKWDKLFTEEGIIHQRTTKATPQQNGVAERMNRTLQNSLTAMLHQANLPPSFWGEGLALLTRIVNATPTAAVTNMTPFEAWTGQKPNLADLQTFGCRAFVHVQRTDRKSLEPKSNKCIYLGFETGYKGWKCYNAESKKIIISRDVIFDESSFPGVGSDKTEPLTTWLPANDDECNIPPIPEPPAETPPSTPTPPDPRPPSPTPPAQRKSTRIRVPPGTTEATILDQVKESAKNKPSWTFADSEEDVEGLLDEELSNDGGEEEEQADAISSTIPHTSADPKSFKEAMRRPDAQQWREACQTEVDALKSNGTWIIVPRPPGVKPLGSKWVLKTKRTADGSIDRYKGRVVGKGFSQRPGIDYNETFSPTARWAALRTILAMAAIAGDFVESVDISNAYLNGILGDDVDIYMEQPEGFHEGDPSDVIKLIKALYGLKQSGRLWYEALGRALDKLGFTRLESDPSVYIWQKDDVRVVIPVFVDDLTLVSNSKEKLNQIKIELAEAFKLKDAGPISFLLGVKIDYNREGKHMQLSQRQYIIDLLERYGMADCKPVSTPMNPGEKLSKKLGPTTKEGKEQMLNVPYLNAVGALNYLSIATRPDISYAVSKLARFNSNPGPDHWTAVKHLMRYLKGTIDLKLTYAENGSEELFQTYADVDHGGDIDDGQSTTGYVVKIGTGAVSWSSKLQGIVALSTTEAEYVAAVAGGTEIIWMRKLLGELGYTFNKASTIHMDNQSAISVAKNPEHHGRMKHLDLRFFWLRHAVRRGLIAPKYIPTDTMPADLLTKALPKPAVEQHRKMLGLM